MKIVALSILADQQAAKNAQQSAQLVELGFEYVTDMDGYKLFRKRK
jgi:hypothetical protein